MLSTGNAPGSKKSPGVRSATVKLTSPLIGAISLTVSKGGIYPGREGGATGMAPSVSAGTWGSYSHAVATPGSHVWDPKQGQAL